MKYLNLIILTFLSLFSSLGSAGVKITATQSTVGENLMSGDDLIATEYTFPGVIQKAYLDTFTNTMTVVQQRKSNWGNWLKSRGDLALFSLPDQKISWSKRIDYENSKVLQYNDNIFLESDNMLNCLDIMDGEELWDAKVNLKYIDPLMNIGIGYTYRSAIGVTNTLKGVDLKTGEIIWKREINQDYNWSNQIIHVNDSVILIVAAGLHTINLKTGEGWDYDMITGENEINIVNSDVYHIKDVYAFTKYSGVFLKNKVISSVGSNLLSENGYIYFASKELLIKTDLEGNVQWTFPIPSGKASSSELFLKNNKLYLLNKGYAYYNESMVGPLDPNEYDPSVKGKVKDEKISYGKPYFTAFNPATGEQLFMKEIESDDQIIQDSKVEEERLILMYQDRIKALSLADGTLSTDKSFLINVLDPFNALIRDKVYLKSSSVDGRKVLDPLHYYLIRTKDDNLILIDHNFEFVENLVLFDNYLQYNSSTNGYDVYSNASESVILNKAGKKVANLSVSGNQIIVDKVLYEIKTSSFVIVDLNAVLTD
ncbi:PQQ-binding-like beta-propeller repeat protein [Saccharicrinis sp. FJH54]|uniref:outer membrane protein assembly factor BamB family protein n=1 Tax=Saccharicrinis sp. FJH54 TaxID=3344665 RepID=UPI0035D4115B